jgi:hypothetical protein
MDGKDIEEIGYAQIKLTLPFFRAGEGNYEKVRSV